MAADFAVEGNYQKAWSLAAGTIRLLPLESDPLDPPLSEALRQYHDRKSPETARALTKAYFLKNDWDNVIKMTSLCESAPILRMASLASTKLNLWNQAWEELARAIRLEDPTFSPE